VVPPGRNYRRPHNPRRHRARVPTTLGIPSRAQRSFLVIHQPHRVYIHIELARPAHTFLVSAIVAVASVCATFAITGTPWTSTSSSSSKRNALPRLCRRRTQVLRQAQFHRGSIEQRIRGGGAAAATGATLASAKLVSC